MSAPYQRGPPPPVPIHSRPPRPTQQNTNHSAPPLPNAHQSISPSTGYPQMPPAYAWQPNVQTVPSPPMLPPLPPRPNKSVPVQSIRSETASWNSFPTQSQPPAPVQVPPLPPRPNVNNEPTPWNAATTSPPGSFSRWAPPGTTEKKSVPLPFSQPSHQISLARPKFCPKFMSLCLPGARWHGIPSITTNFGICDRCYLEHIAPSRFASQFTTLPPFADPNTIFNCDFYNSKSKRLWTQVLASGEIERYKQFMKERAESPHSVCAGPQGVKGSALNAPPKWYTATSIPDFIICSFCYDDEVAGTSVAQYFTEYHTLKGHGPDDVWVCRLSMSNLFRPYLHEVLAGEADWSKFSESVTIRLQTPSCPGRGVAVKPSSRAWVTLKKTIPGMVVCSACYFDQIVPCTTTPGFSADTFEKVSDEVVLESEKANAQWSCDMSIPGVILTCAELYNPPSETQKGAYEAFWRKAVTHQISNGCYNHEQSAISPNVKSYALKSSCGPLSSRPTAFDICEPCYISFVQSLGLERFFTETRYRETENAILLCDMSWKNPKFQGLLVKLTEAFGMDDFRIFETYVKERLHLLPCPGIMPATGRYWYGIGSGFAACPTCYLDYIKPSPLDHLITARNVYEPTSMHFMLCTNRTRALWANACASNSVTEFLEFQRKRSAVHAQVIPEILALRSTWEGRKNTKDTYFSMATALTANSAMVSTSASMPFNSISTALTMSHTAGSSLRRSDEMFAKANAIVVITEAESEREQKLLHIWAEVE